MTLEQRQQIKDKMIHHLGDRLEAFWGENSRITTYDPFGDEVYFDLGSHDTFAVTERILKSAEDRLFLVLLNDACLDPERLDRFMKPYVEEARAFIEEKAIAVAAEL